MIKFIVIVLTLYVLILIASAVWQAKIIFHPQVLSSNYKYALGTHDEEVFLKTKDDEIINGIFYGSNTGRVILYFHGNAGSLASWQHIAPVFTERGFSALIIDYRGYGKSTGQPSEQGFYLDAEAAIDFLLHVKGYSTKDIIIYGRSIGSGVAVELAQRYSVSGLVLESPYTSLTSLAKQKAPYLIPSLYLKFHFDNIKKINQINCPLVIIHGMDDGLIPYTHATTLYHQYNGHKKLVGIPQGQHNDLSRFAKYHEAMDELNSF